MKEKMGSDYKGETKTNGLSGKRKKEKGPV